MSGNGHTPAWVVQSDLVVADQTDPAAVYLALGFVRSAIEPTINGITPPSRYCARHQPNGADGDCHRCGTARVYRTETWPYRPEGVEYRTYQAAADELVKQQGRPLGRELNRQAVVEKLSRNPDAAMFGFGGPSDQKAADWQLLADLESGAAWERELEQRARDDEEFQ
jgi:hypothetical protein